MLERVTDPGTYQSFQHFITHAPWSAERVWRQLRTVIVERDGGADSRCARASRNRARTRSAWPVSTVGRWAKSPIAKWRSPRPCGQASVRGCWVRRCILPEEWLTPEARQRAQIPAAIQFQEKWRLALALLRQTRAAGVQVTAVLGDAEFGDNGTLRQYPPPRRAPLRPRDLLASDRVPRRRATSALRGARDRRAVAAARLAHRHVAQWRQSAVERLLRGAAGHARPTLAAPPSRARGLAPVRTRSRRHTAHQGTTSSRCRPPRR